ncbi:Non-structural maintenance of chromosome element 4 [Smittium mucronatum]|uniref:Non-structural maintenance of chromosomes element 4 n=1 Tax=Smittium mucronatum TaxID=133383 RepID=A0A1R0H1X7_9FUNG|nr:Non-structural maintenance of chromosome element 4 [Smittium mucronatum]
MPKYHEESLTPSRSKKTELIESSADFLAEELIQTNKLFEEVRTTYEASLDSRLLLMSANIGEVKARKLRLEASGIEIDEFVRKIRKQLFGLHAESREAAGVIPDWTKVGKIAANFTNRVPSLDILSGPFSSEPPKQRAARKPSTNADSTSGNSSHKSAKTQVNELNQLDFKRQVNETTKRVRQIHTLLEQVGLVNLFEFVVNPESFSETVENIFYLSFLIRDGKASIDDESGQPMIAACEPPDQDAYQAGLIKKQVVFDLDMQLWSELISSYGIKKSIIPSRDS